MNDETRTRYLAWVLRVAGVGLLIWFSTLFIITATDSSLGQEGGALAWMRWMPFSKHVELMLYIIYVVWAVFMVRASSDPLRYLSFVEFTAWANLAHGALMTVQTFFVPHHMHKLYTDDTLSLFVSGLLFWLRPRGSDEASALRRESGPA